MGSKCLGLRVLKEIQSLSPNTLIGAITIDDKSDTRTALTDFKELSITTGLPLYVAKNRKHSEETIRNLKPDLCLVVGWYWLISEEILRLIPYGFIGIHYSLLPKYRGGSPLIWAIINDEREVGFSLFSFAEGIDDGPLWAQGTVTVEDGDYVSDTLRKLEEKTIEVLLKKYPSIINGTITPVEQRHELATYCAQRLPNDGNVNWYKPARYVYNFIRAQSDPYPGAFTWYENGMLRIWKARLFEYEYSGTPGQVAKIDSDGVYVICGDNRAVIVEEVEIAGKRGEAKKFIKSIKARLSNTIAKAITDVNVMRMKG